MTDFKFDKNGFCLWVNWYVNGEYWDHSRYNAEWSLFPGDELETLCHKIKIIRYTEVRHADGWTEIKVDIEEPIRIESPPHTPLPHERMFYDGSIMELPESYDNGEEVWVGLGAQVLPSQ